MSVYEGLYEGYTLTYEASGTITEDEAGKPVESGGPKTVRAWLEPTRAPQVAAMVGADSSSVAVEGGLLGVTEFPPELTTGSVVTVTVRGREQKLTLFISPPPPFALVEELTGPLFWGRLSG